MGGNEYQLSLVEIYYVLWVESLELYKRFMRMDA